LLPLFSKAMAPEQFDGHACLKFSTYYTGPAYNGPVKIWIDSTTGAPVCVYGAGNGRYLEEHFSWLPINFEKPGTEEFFNTAHIAPFFTTYLTP
jgi:hypothetical protein